MEARAEQVQFELLCAIVNFGFGSRVCRIAKEQGVLGSTIVLGMGTTKRHRLLEALELCDMRKEIVLMVAERTAGRAALEAMRRKLQLDKPNHGIAFAMPLSAFLGAGDYDYRYTTRNGGADDTMYNAVFTIVDKGRGELVMEAASKAGAKGGTIINARGSGIHERGMLFHMEIEPEKEMVLILCEQHLTEGIATAICTDLEIDQPGNGIIFVQEVTQTYGIHE